MAGNWTNEDKQQIAKTFGVLATIQKSYGNDIDIRATLTAWEYVLSDYTASQVCQAMEAWVKKESTMPTPADLIKMINPPTPKITQTEYITAKENWAKEGHKSHCYWKGVMNDFEKQEGEGRQVEPIADAPLNQLIGDITKKLENGNN